MTAPIKRRIPRSFGDYSDFEENPLNEAESERVAKHFLYLNERGLPIPQNLQSAMTLYAKTQYEKKHSLVSNAKKGRPPSTVPNSYLAMLVWYRCNIEKDNYTSTIKRDIGPFEKIAESFKTTDLQAKRAAVLDGDIDDIQRIDSESSVKKANKNFKKYGFIPDSNLHNEIQAEIFCVQVLGYSVEKAAVHKKKLIDTWMENHFKSQGQ